MLEILKHLKCWFVCMCVCVIYFILFFSLFIFKYEIYCQIGFHTTPSAHPNRWPPQYLSPTLASLPPPINPQFVLNF